MTWIYYALAIAVLLLGFAFTYKKDSKALKITFLIICFIMLAAVGAVRYETGFDYYSYLRVYNDIGSLPWSKLFIYNYEPGFFILSKLLYMVTPHFQLLYIATSIIITALIMIYIYKESTNPTLSVFLYITFTFYYWSLNLVRQSFAGAICVFSVKFIKEKKPIHFIITVLIAACFHKTALFMLPFYILARIKFSWKYAVAVTGATIAGFILVEPVFYKVQEILYGCYNDKSLYTQPSSILYGLLPLIVFLAILPFFKKMQEKDESSYIYYNLFMFASAVSVFIAKIFIIERLALYLFLPSIIFVPQVIDSLKPSAKEQESYNALKSGSKKLKGTEYKKAYKQASATKEKISDARAFYGFAVGALIVFGFAQQGFALANNYHGVAEYHTIFNKPETTVLSYKRALPENRPLLEKLGYPTE